MLWRVRTTLPDRPGALAVLAHYCGEAGVDIRRLQVFPDAGEVTDELIIATPDDWEAVRVASLLTEAGGGTVVVRPAQEASLGDQPTRYVEAARTILERPMLFPEVVARLFDAEAEAPAGSSGGMYDSHDVMTMMVAEVDVQLYRAVKFTAAERARGAAMAALVNDVLQRSRDQLAISSGTPPRRLDDGATPQYAIGGDTVTAYVEGVAVGVAQILAGVPGTEGVEEARSITLRVDPAWRRRGIGTRLLIDAARLAHGLGAGEVVVTARSDNQAILPMVLAAGMRGRIRMAGDELTVRVTVRDFKPL